MVQRKCIQHADERLFNFIILFKFFQILFDHNTSVDSGFDLWARLTNLQSHKLIDLIIFFPFPKEIRLGYLILPITSTNNLCNSKFQDHNYDMFLGEQNKPMPLYHILIMHACEPGKKKKNHV